MSNPVIGEDDFVDVWGAKAQESGELFTYAEIEHQDCRRIWTIIEGEDDSLYAQAGYHIVNNIGYVLTDKPWLTGLEEALWFENDDRTCSECGQPADDGEGWDGLCGDCADLADPSPD